MAAERAAVSQPDSGKRVKISRPGDREEQQARTLARQAVTGAPACTACADAVTPCPACRAAAGSVPADGVHRSVVLPAPVTRALSGAGESLPGPTRAHFERRLGAELGGVRLHRDAGADLAARSLGANAFTLGNRIAFAAGAYRPETRDGLERLGHELVHTLQPGAAASLRRDDGAVAPVAAPSANAAAGTGTAEVATSIAAAMREGNVGAAVMPLRGGSAVEIGAIRGAVNQQTGVWLELWLVGRKHRSETIATAIALGTGLLGAAGSLLSPGRHPAPGSATPEEGLRLLWPALPLIERLNVYDEGYREIEQAQIDVIRVASPALRAEATAAVNSDRLNRVLEQLDPKEEFDARLLLDPAWAYDAAERLLRRAPGVLSDAEDEVFDALIALRPALRQRFFDQHFLDLFRLFDAQRFRLASALARGSEAQALIIRLRIATEGRIDDQAAIQAVVDRAVALLTERRDLRAALAGTDLPSAERTQAEARLHELDDLDSLLRFQRGADGMLGGRTFMGLLAEARGTAEGLGADTARLGGFADPTQARRYAFEAAKQRILLAAGQVDEIRAVIMGLHAPPPVPTAAATSAVAAGAASPVTPAAREQEQHLADIQFRQDLLADPAVRAVVDGLVGSERDRVRLAVAADRFDEVLARLNLALNGGRYGEFFQLTLTIARNPNWRSRYEATAGEVTSTYARVQGEPRRIMLEILRTQRVPLAQVLAYSGDVELLRAAFADLDEGERERLRLGYALAHEPARIGPPTLAETEALRTFQDLESQVRRSQTTLGITDAAGIAAVLAAILGNAPTAVELASGEGRYRAAALLHHQIAAREALGRGASAHFTETDETMLAAAREFEAQWLVLGDRRTLTVIEYAALLALYERFDSRTQEFTDASNTAGELAGMVAATVAGVVIVAATGGVATPGVIALAAAAGGGARVVTREMFGDQYYNALSDQGARDVLLGAVDGALAVASASLAARGAELLGLGGHVLTAGAARIAGGAAEQATQGLARRVAAGAVEAAIDGAISGTVSEAFGAMSDARTWRRGIFEGLVRVGQSALVGGLTGLAGGALIGAALPVIGRGARWAWDTAAAGRIESALARAGAGETLTAARRAARAGNLDALDRLVGELETHLSADEAGVLRRQLYADLEATLGHPPGTAGAATPEQARLLAQTSTLEGDALSAAQREAEIDIVRRSEPRPSELEGYVDEVDLGNRHSWKRRADGTWCRFTKPSLCGTAITGAASMRPRVRVSSPPPHGYRLVRLDDISQLPRNLDGRTLAPLPEGIVYEFPGGNRVWREGDVIRHDSVLGPGTGRRDTELDMFSASESGRPELAGMERAHTLGQGTGFESPFGIFYAPGEVNQIIQNNGLEELFRGFRDSARPGESFHVSTMTTPHPNGSQRLKEIRYRVEVSRNGGSRDFLFEYVINVGNNVPNPTVTHGLANVTESPDLSHYFDLVDVPERLRSRFAVRAGGAGGTGAVVRAHNWSAIEDLIDDPVATAALPADYIKSQDAAGLWTIRRRVANDADFQRLTVRTRPDGIQVVAVWRPFN